MGNSKQVNICKILSIHPLDGWVSNPKFSFFIIIVDMESVSSVKGSFCFPSQCISFPLLIVLILLMGSEA